MCPMFYQAQIVNADQLPLPIVTENSVEICLNSRYSQHSLSGTASIRQMSNVIWAAGIIPFTGTHRDIYVATPDGTYLYDPNDHSLSRHSSEVRDDGAFALIYESERDFDTGVYAGYSGFRVFVPEHRILGGELPKRTWIPKGKVNFWSTISSRADN